MSKRLLISLFILIVGVMVLSGCLSKSDVATDDEKFIPQAAAPVEWNFIVYMDGDNNLEQFAISDINEMEQVGSDANMNILVLIDRISGYDSSNGNWTGTRLYRITKDNANSSTIVSTLVADYGELDMSNPTNLKNFIVNCQTLYPANRTVLTLWNHGDGIYPRTGEKRGICWDDTTGTSAWSCLTDAEVLSALSQARAITGKKIDILNSDACLMQTMEVAYEWRTEASYIVGSEEVIPGEGNNYDTLLTTLKNSPLQSTETFAKAIVNDYYNYYRTQSTTSSVLNMGTPFTNLITAFKDFATAMYNTTDLAAVTSARTATVSFTYDEYKDLYAFANNISTRTTDTNVINKANALKTAITNAVINHKETGSFVGKAYGLAIFLPKGTQYAPYAAANQYPSFLLSVDSNWDDFVKRYVQYTGGSI